MQLSILSRLAKAAPELLEDILRQKLQQHTGREYRLLLLVAPVGDVRQVKMDLSDVFETNVSRTKEGRDEVVLEAAQVKADAVVQEPHRYLM